MDDRPGHAVRSALSVSVAISAAAVIAVATALTTTARDDLHAAADRSSVLHLGLLSGGIAVAAVLVSALVTFTLVRRWEARHQRDLTHSLEVTRDAIRLAERGGRLHRQVLSSPPLPLPRLASLAAELETIDNLARSLPLRRADTSRPGDGPVVATDAALHTLENETSALHTLAIEASVVGTMAALEAYRSSDPGERTLLEGFSQQVNQLADRWRDSSRSATSATLVAREHLPGHRAHPGPQPIDLFSAVTRARGDIRRLVEELQHASRATELVANESAALESRLWTHAELAEDLSAAPDHDDDAAGDVAAAR